MRSTSSSRSAARMGGGASRTLIQSNWTWEWTKPKASQAAGPPCAPYECWTGIQYETNADHMSRRPVSYPWGMPLERDEQLPKLAREVTAEQGNKGQAIALA